MHIQMSIEPEAWGRILCFLRIKKKHEIKRSYASLNNGTPQTRKIINPLYRKIFVTISIISIQKEAWN